VGDLFPRKRIKEAKQMLIHRLTKIIKQDTDDNISFVECDHPFSGVARSQVILTFKEQKTRVSVVQISDASKMYICIISRKGKKTEGDFGGHYEWQEVWFKPTLEDKYLPQVYKFIKLMVDNANKFYSKAMAISYKEAIAKLTNK
jgi:hypothetical protein